MIDVSNVCDPSTHEQIKADASRWFSLHLNGTMPTYDDEPGAPQLLELRTCGCGSTIAKPVQP